MRYGPILLTFLALLQAALMASVPGRTAPEEPRSRCAPEVEGMALLVDRIGDSRYGLLDPIEPDAEPAVTPREGDPIFLIQPEREQWRNPDEVRHLIELEANNHGLDPLLIESIVRHESGFNPKAVSPVGAMGLMQLMPETAVSLGVTDPFDPSQNVSAGVAYFAQQVDRYRGNVPLALAAYNAGPAAVTRYGGIPPYAETLQYVDSVMGEYVWARDTVDQEAYATR